MTLEELCDHLATISRQLISQEKTLNEIRRNTEAIKPESKAQDIVNKELCRRIAVLEQDYHTMKKDKKTFSLKLNPYCK